MWRHRPRKPRATGRSGRHHGRSSRRHHGSRSWHRTAARPVGPTCNAARAPGCLMPGRPTPAGRQRPRSIAERVRRTDPTCRWRPVSAPSRSCASRARGRRGGSTCRSPREGRCRPDRTRQRSGSAMSPGRRLRAAGGRRKRGCCGRRSSASRLPLLVLRYGADRRARETGMSVSPIIGTRRTTSRRQNRTERAGREVWGRGAATGRLVLRRLDGRGVHLAAPGALGRGLRRGGAGRPG